MSNKKGYEETLSYQLETFINGIPGSVYWKNKKGVYLGCNNTVLIKGNLKSKDDIIGKTDRDVWPEMAKSLRKKDLAVMRSNKTIEMEETVVLKSSERLYFSSVKSPLRDENGNIIGVIGNSVDITELKEAKQNAEAASQAKTQFLALMSHELRIPLTGIISTASILADSDFTLEETREFGKIIEKSGKYLLSTIDSILDFAKLEANKFDLSLSPINIKFLIDEITSALSASAKEKGLKLSVIYKINPGLAIISDPMVLRLIFTNLLGNAIKYTMHGSIVVHVGSTIRRSKGLLTLQVSFKDSGIGIPKDKLVFIFDRFAQVETGYIRQTSRQGTGLGLSIVKKLTDLLKGKIEVKSKIDSGSVFQFTADFPIYQNPIAKKKWESSLKNIRILSVENSTSLQTYICRHLHSIKCDVVNNSQLVNKLLTAQQYNEAYDIVIFDGSHDNLSIQNNIKKIKRIKSLRMPLFLLFFDNQKEAKLSKLTSEFEGVLIKPKKSIAFRAHVKSEWIKWNSKTTTK